MEGWEVGATEERALEASPPATGAEARAANEGAAEEDEDDADAEEEGREGRGGRE